MSFRLTTGYSKPIYEDIPSPLSFTTVDNLILKSRVRRWYKHLCKTDIIPTLKTKWEPDYSGDHLQLRLVILISRVPETINFQELLPGLQNKVDRHTAGDVTSFTTHLVKDGWAAIKESSINDPLLLTVYLQPDDQLLGFPLNGKWTSSHLEAVLE